MTNRFLSLTFFLLFFGLYSFTAAPQLAPYRDAGEMVTVIKTLGVAHPPGYPLYTLLGQLSGLFVFGNASYQVNLFSALCASLALLISFWTLAKWIPWYSSALVVALVGVSHPFWELACVSEMYSLGVLWLAALLYVYFFLKNTPILFFLLGLGLGVRMDLLLLIPTFALWLHHQQRLPIPSSILMFLLGTSIYLYLTIRSSSNPWVDWGNPETLWATFASATRKSYSGTLDLLSLSYKKGENFGVNMLLFGQNLKTTLGWVGCAAAMWGAWISFRSNKKDAFLIFVMFLVMGPVFLFLANMPPNPHSIAIVEASYLFPIVLLMFFIAWGVKHKFVLWILLLSFPMQLVQGYQRSSKRNNLFVRDFIENVWRSVPKGATAVFHDDVQLFSLWMSQLVDKRRPDVRLIASGLSASRWYQEMISRWPTRQGTHFSLKEPQGWRDLLKNESPASVVVGYDVDFSSLNEFLISPKGFLAEVSISQKDKTQDPSLSVLRHLGLYRNRAFYGETPDFFSSDLIGDLSRAHHQQAFYSMVNKRDDVIWYFTRSAILDETFVRAWSDLGFYFFEKSDYLRAQDAYLHAMDGFERTLQLAKTYKSLPDVVNGLRGDYSLALTHFGVIQERLGKLDEARQYYERSNMVAPNAQAHYNLAVTYWGKDWAQVVRYLEGAIRLNPQMAEAHGYLVKAKQMAERR